MSAGSATPTAVLRGVVDLYGNSGDGHAPSRLSGIVEGSLFPGHWLRVEVSARTPVADKYPGDVLARCTLTLTGCSNTGDCGEVFK